METINTIVTLLETGRHEQALKAYEQILLQGSNDERYFLAEALFNFGFLEEARKLYQCLLAIFPNEGELIVLLAEVLMELGEEEQAILELEKIHEDDPAFAESMLLLADLYQMEGLYEVSEKKLLQAKSLLPDEVVIDFALGELYAEEGKFIQAIDCYEKVLKKEDEIAGVNVNLRMADCLSGGGAFEEALSFYEKALEKKLEINTLFHYGFTALQAGYNRKAIEKFLELKELDPDYTSMYVYLARAYEREEESEKGFEVIKEGLKYDEFNKDLYVYGGKLALKTGNEQEAETLFREALAIDPEMTEAALTLNKLLLHQERYEDVLEVVNMMEGAGETEPQFKWDAAISYQKLEEYSQALNRYESAYTYYKDTTDFLVDYGYFLMEEGKREGAVEVFNKLLEQDPSNEEFLDIRQRLLDDGY
ncbi:tetratricopeptide repeat protein [Bacillus benzoevorans]|uniref:Tetratricopeptide (TPR) repeat protein n=1 Tax=Bacillus benzoevorans TaxID=1456 RepID=A0A7X0HRV2_9BACI|nr:tetratricopeptide repeat protein [Bacillus benzoevorans]MBB6444692.1 tetratricopeptide (TPR) repeat protein [Bacillus benzoevorans]